MHISALLAILILGLWTICQQVAAMNATITLQMGEINGVCADAPYKYVTYTGNVTKGKLLGFFVVEEETLRKARQESLKNQTDGARISYRYAMNASCVGNKNLRNTTCDIGAEAPVPIFSVTENPCILVDNTGGKEVAVVNILYAFTNETKFPSAGNAFSSKYNDGAMFGALIGLLMLLAVPW
ncbi:hypothetical protein THASP1DRAFT_23994 [Thamnocephalis sphaerospora]|uniref:Mannose-6-phosphate receptor binding domain-containing protein n=1 Tax=Thamnocephalis sphaerospora TaxID=78915 RepID=A0A4P9XQY5_9FUNG|nr:hypothetical protein THASP1DRAFT_23994 [Thamnocephalis sphaerospora]|eukprot:RKP07921.1 hypothetical protein THASP1DRAFT_23994 [Thamnocephalis sphaerospora]